jgi:hypothetical protein
VCFVKSFGRFAKSSCLSNWRFESCKSGFWFLAKVFVCSGQAFLAVAVFQVFGSQKLAFVFFSHIFIFGFVRLQKSASRFLAKILASKRFYFA